jgi:hypothetical protein
MSDVPDHADGPTRSARWRPVLVAVAILVGQAVLFGPSLVGSKILLPLDILGQRNHYLPHTVGLTDVQPENYVLSDQVLHAEPTRLFAAAELRAGRFPLWNPYEFAGVPHVLMRFSPFMLLRTLTPSRLILPWVQVLVALLAGLGVYGFCRKTLQLSFWPSAVVAWCYPLGAYFVLWQGYGHTWSLAWLPWLLVAEDAALRRKHRAAGMLVAVLTFLTLASGPLDTGAQELMVAGGFAVWRYFAIHGRGWRARPALRGGSLLVLGWGAGLLLTAPEVLSMAAYAKTGARVARRGHGALERPPAGLAALQQNLPCHPSRDAYNTDLLDLPRPATASWRGSRKPKAGSAVPGARGASCCAPRRHAAYPEWVPRPSRAPSQLAGMAVESWPFQGSTAVSE